MKRFIYLFLSAKAGVSDKRQVIKTERRWSVLDGGFLFVIGKDIDLLVRSFRFLLQGCI